LEDSARINRQIRCQVKRKVSQDQEKIIGLDDARYILHASSRQMDTWQQEGRFAQRQTTEGRPALSETDLKALANGPDALKVALEGFALDVTTREADESSGRNKTFVSQIAQLIEQYHEYIGTLEEIHKTYHDQIHPLHDESALRAAYILYAKVIRLLRMACLCLQHHFWDALILFRPIDEAVELGQYFILSESTPHGSEHLRRWFRENHSPKNEECRKVIGAYMDSVVPPQPGQRPFKEVMTGLHYKKSKAIHHAHHDIMETYRAKIVHSKLTGLGFDYGPCSYPRKMLEVTELFQSSIWTAVQGFLVCFKDRLPLSQEHVERLMALDQLFSSQTSDRSHASP
jgi:hypothetical protein